MNKEYSADILIVDDQPENLRVLGNLLLLEGYRVRQAPSGKLALRAAEQQAPDLILLDISMPEMDGFEVCHRLKEDPDLRSVPVIYLSAFTETESKLKAFDAGGVDYITKPFEGREIVARVKAHCRLKITQEALSKKNIELEQTLMQLKDAQAQLVQSEKMASLGLLTAGIAHEINNPINFVCSGVKGLENLLQEFSQTVESETSGARLAQEMEELLGCVETGARRTAEIVSGLRIFSRLDESDKKVCEIHENIDSALMMLSHRIGHEVSIVKIYGELPLLLCYPGKLNQVFINCLSNSVDASVSLPDRELKEVRISTAVQNQDGQAYIRIQIDNTGEPISETTKQHLFEPFFTTKEVGKGTGLGLSISHGIIEDHGGTIEIYNLPDHKGVGTCILLPIPDMEEETL